MKNIKTAAMAVEKMDGYLRDKFQTSSEKLWESTYPKHQICKRKNGGSFSVSDHIHAMVYSMLTNSSVWDRFSDKIDIETGCIPEIDRIFFKYDPQKLIHCSPDALYEQLRGCAGLRTYKQICALIETNIPKLLRLEETFGSIDAYYKTFESPNDPYSKKLIKELSQKGENKMYEFAEALNAEYLRNVGYSIPKPDRHIRRILGKNRLACSEYEDVPLWDVFDIVGDIARECGKDSAEVDYILWSYCATGYGQVCKKRNPGCEICAAKDYCGANN